MLKPNCQWNDNPNFLFEVNGESNSDYAKNIENRHSVSGNTTMVCGAPVMMKSKMQPFVTLSSCEAELVSATSNAQDMFFVMRILESMGLQVRKPMILKIDNKGSVDWINNWSVGGRTRHMDTRCHFLRELKELGLILPQWTSGAENPSDMFTKNLGGSPFQKHIETYCGRDGHMKAFSPREGGRVGGEPKP